MAVKLKRHSGAKKRFRKKGRDNFSFRRSNRNHILTKKGSKRKAHLRKDALASQADKRSVKRMLLVA